MRTFGILTFIFLIASHSGASAATFESAVRAYESGDYETAVTEFRELAEEGDPDAQALLGLMYIEGQAVEPDMAEAIRWYARAAEQGQMDAQFMLGRIAMEGAGGTAEDPETAALWMREAARRGHVFAQFELGSMYAQGEGVTANEDEAARWFRAAADQGHRDAQYNLGVMYLSGRGVGQDPAEALNWFRLAAEQGHRDAQYNLGISFLTGNVVEPDPEQAQHWLEEAASQDQINAIVAMGLLKYQGARETEDGPYVIERDPTEAARYFLRAAEAGNPEGQYFLARLYSLGQGVELDYVEAYAWNSLAARRARAGTEFGQSVAELQDSLIDLMNTSERNAADTLAADRAAAIASN